MKPLIDYTLDNGIAKLSMNNGKANAMSYEMISAINQGLDQAENDKAAVMLIGQTSIFSAGFDLKTFQQSHQAAIDMILAGLLLCKRLLSFPHPVIGVCTGHAIAQGCITLMSCDYRIGVNGNYKLGFNETTIGMTMPQYAIDIAHSRFTPSFFNRCMINAQIVKPETALAAGILDQVVTQEALLSTAEAECRRLNALNGEVFNRTKAKCNQALLQALDEAYQKDTADFNKIDAFF